MGLGFRYGDSGSGCRIPDHVEVRTDPGVEVWGLGFRVVGLGFKVWGFEFRVQTPIVCRTEDRPPPRPGIWFMVQDLAISR